MKRSAVAVLVAFAAALLVGGCGGGSGSSSQRSSPSPAPEGAPKKATAPNAPAGSKVVACTEGREETVQLRATAVSCDTARTTVQHWDSSHVCTLGKGDSRSSCSLGGFRCQATRVDRGAAVSCARPGGDVSWIAKAWLLKKSADG